MNDKPQVIPGTVVSLQAGRPDQSVEATRNGMCPRSAPVYLAPRLHRQATQTTRLRLPELEDNMKNFLVVVLAALTVGCANPPPRAEQSAGIDLGADSAAASRTCTKPPYPPASLAAGKQGSTVVSFTVGPDGNIFEAQVAKSSGHPELDAEVVKAVLRCRAQPKLVEGKPVQFKSRVTYVWKYEVQR